TMSVRRRRDQTSVGDVVSLRCQHVNIDLSVIRSTIRTPAFRLTPSPIPPLTWRVITLTMKGIIYCRVSSLEQVQGTSLEHQKEACLTYARDRTIEIAGIFVEKGE